MVEATFEANNSVSLRSLAAIVREMIVVLTKWKLRLQIAIMNVIINLTYFAEFGN